MHYLELRELLHDRLNSDGNADDQHNDPWTDFIEVTTNELKGVAQDKFKWEMSHGLEQIVEESYVRIP